MDFIFDELSATKLLENTLKHPRSNFIVCFSNYIPTSLSIVGGEYSQQKCFYDKKLQKIILNIKKFLVSVRLFVLSKIKNDFCISYQSLSLLGQKRYLTIW